VTYEAPSFEKNAFTCPHCGAFAQVEKIFLHSQVPNGFQSTDWRLSRCLACRRESPWYGNELKWPLVQMGPVAHEAMPDSIKVLYVEAREVGIRSPRSAAALLRLALQHLLIQIAEERDINDAIAKLVQDGLPTRIQQAMDVLRVVGNNAVHPGEIQLDEQPETAAALFTLLNIVVEDRIAQPHQIDEMYKTLPARALEAIARRDEKR
jgi:hypothetical protein